MEAIHITSAEQLRQVAIAWDDLWWRSATTMPTVRAELIVQWLEQFAPDTRFHAVVVQHNGQYIAALPLVARKQRRVLRTGALPNNPWSPSGDLLVDVDCDLDRVLDVMVTAFRQLPWKMLWFDTALPETTRWQALANALQRATMPFAARERYRVAHLSCEGDFDSLRKKYSKNLRKSINKATRRLEEQGELRLRFETPNVADAERLLRRGFAVEDKSWKAKAGTSIMCSPGMPEFYVRQAELLAERGELVLAFLEHNGQPIAYEYAWNAKGVYHSFKVGYDEQFAWASPGQLLQHKLLEQCHTDSEVHSMDCLGPIGQAVQQFRPESYGIGRMVIAIRGLLSRATLFAYQHVWPKVARRRNATQADGSATAKTTSVP